MTETHPVCRAFPYCGGHGRCPMCALCDALTVTASAPPCSCRGDAEGCAANCDPTFCGCARAAHYFAEVKP